MTSEDSEASETPTEASRQSSGERSDPRDDRSGTDDDIPLDITGHEDRERPDGGTEFLTGSDDSSASDSPSGPDSPPEPEVDDPDPEDNDGDEEEEVEPVEVLVNLAEEGEIDPWDIDIVAVTDKFLDRLDEADLRTSGRALFYASVLLRMKGDAMLEDDDEEEEEPWDEPWEQAMAGEEVEPDVDPFSSLEQEMDRRLERKRARGMPQTLDELVRDLREAERDNWWKESREYDTSDSPDGFQRGTQELDYRAADDLRMDDEPSAADVTEKTHDENIDDVIEEVQTTLWEHYDQGRKEVLFREIEEAGGARVQTFLALLFLAHRDQVRLQQDELFGDLWIQDPSADAVPDGAVAD